MFARRLALRVGRRGWHDCASPGRLGDPAPDASLPSALRAYLGLLHRRPFTVSMASAGAAAAAGDTLAQLITWSDAETRLGDAMRLIVREAPHRGAMQAEANRAALQTLREGVTEELGPVRTLRFAALVGVLAGGAGEYWFRFALLPTFPGWTYEVALRTIFDQALFSPAVLAAVVGGTALLGQNGDVAYARHKLQHDWPTALGRMWTLWTCGAMASYLLVPTPWQPLCASGLATMWACDVSRRVHLPTARRGFAVTHAPERVGAHLRDQMSVPR